MPDPVYREGLYAIYASNGVFLNNPSLMDALLYVGQTGDIHSCFMGHELWGRWREDANRMSLNYISAFLLFTDNWNWTKEQREQLEISIIKRHNPISNKTHTYVWTS